MLTHLLDGRDAASYAQHEPHVVAQCDRVLALVTTLEGMTPKARQTRELSQVFGLLDDVDA